MPSPKLTSLEIVPNRTGAAVPSLGVPDVLDVIEDPLTRSSAQVDALGEIYKNMAPGQGTSTVVLLAGQAGDAGSSGDDLQWIEVPGAEVIDGHTLLARLPSGAPALWPTLAVLARGGVLYDDAGWVNPDVPGLGRIGSAPFPVVPCGSDPLGRALINPGDLEAFGGAIQPPRGDRVVAVRCVPRPPRLLWSRDEPGRRRTYAGGAVPRLLVGGGPVLLGLFAPGTSYTLNPPLAGWPEGSYLPGDPGVPDGVAILRESSPGSSGRPLGPVLAVAAGAATPDFDWSALTGVAAVAVVEPQTGRCVIRPGAVRPGTPLWYTPLAFRAAGTGLVDPAGGRYFLAPPPEMGEVPLLRVGERLPLVVTVLPTEADVEASPSPGPGAALVARTTGRARFSAQEAGFLGAGAQLRYCGVLMGSASPASAPLSPRLGYRQLGEGSVLRGTTGMLTRTGGRKTLFDGVGTPLVSRRLGPPLSVTEVDLDALLPARAPEGSVVVSRQSGLVAVPPSLPDTATAWVTSTTALLRRAYVGPRLRSMRRHTFSLTGRELLFVASPAGTIVWSAGRIGAGTFGAEAVAADLRSFLAPGGITARADLGCLVLEAAGSGAWVEVLWGPDPAFPELSGCAALGFCPGWRAGASEADSLLVDLGIAVGLPLDGLAVARRYAGIVRDPLDPIPVVVLSVKPLEEDPGLATGAAFWVERGGDRIPVRVGQDAAYDPVGGRLIWASPNRAEVEVREPVVRIDLSSTIPGTLRVSLNGAELARGTGYALDPAGVAEVRLLEAVGSPMCGGTRGVLSANPPALSDPTLEPACARPGSRLRASGGWYRVLEARPGRALLDRPPPAEVRGAEGPWEVVAPPAGPLDPSIVADMVLEPVDYRGAYDARVELSLPGAPAQELVLGPDYTLDPESGLLALTSPLPRGARLRVSGYGADGVGARTEPFDVRIDVAKLRVSARRIGPTEYRFGEVGPIPDPGREAQVRVVVLGSPQNRPDARVDYPPDLEGAGRVVFPTDAPPDGSAVQVTYHSLEAEGGERLAQVPVRPVFASFVRLPAGRTYIGLRGDHTAQMREGCLLRVGASCFWVVQSSYYPARTGGGDATRIDIFPTPETDVGSKGPADRILLLCSDRPLESRVGAWVPVDVSGSVAPGTTQIRLLGIRPGQLVQPGCILELGKHPYAVVGASPGPQPGEVDVILSAPLLRATASATSLSPRITSRPAYPPGTSTFLAARVFPEAPEVVLWPGDGSPGRSLGSREFTADAGSIQLLGGLFLPAGGQLDVFGRALRPIAPENGAWPLLRVSCLRMVQPSLEAGDRMSGSFLTYAPDVLRFSVEDPPALRVLTRADRVRQAELDELEAMQAVGALARIGALLGEASGAEPWGPALEGAARAEEGVLRISMGRPWEGDDPLAGEVVPTRVRARLVRGPAAQKAGPWVLAGHLVDAGGHPVVGILKARAWSGAEVLGMGTSIDVDEDGSVYLPEPRLADVLEIEVEAQVSGRLGVPPALVGQVAASDAPLAALPNNATFLLADRRIAGAEAVRVCLGRGVLDFRGNLELDADTPAGRILPGDVLTVHGTTPRVFRVRAVPEGPDPGRRGLRQNPGRDPAFSADGTLLVKGREAELPGTRESVTFDVSRSWEHSSPALVAPLLQEARRRAARSAVAARAARDAAAVLGADLEEVVALAEDLLAHSQGREALIARAAEQVGQPRPGADLLAILQSVAAPDLGGASGLRHVAREGGPYHAAVLRALSRRYDPVRGTAAQLRRLRQERDG